MDPLEALRNTGYAVFPALYDEDFLARARAELMRVYEGMGRPQLVRSGKHPLPGHPAMVSSTGLTIGQFLAQVPSLAPDYLHPQVRELLFAAMGPDAKLETTAAMISDQSRKALHGWHNHLGGLDEDLMRPVDLDTLDPERIRRVTVLIYLDGLSESIGELIVAPRALGDPLPCPYAEQQYEDGLAGTLRISGPPGTTVVLEERTWHAALGSRQAGYRRFIGAMVVAGWAPPGDNVDPSVDAVEATMWGRA